MSPLASRFVASVECEGSLGFGSQRARKFVKMCATSWANVSFAAELATDAAQRLPQQVDAPRLLALLSMVAT